VPLPRTGVQVPAGTCRPGEDPRDAVLRETREETGRDCFEVRAALGTAEYRVGAPSFRWIPLADGHVLAAGLGARLADLTGY
jgi:8-oxo-dGTP pyrophosphatase MutT (NUDIX family)